MPESSYPRSYPCGARSRTDPNTTALNRGDQNVGSVSGAVVEMVAFFGVFLFRGVVTVGALSKALLH